MVLQEDLQLGSALSPIHSEGDMEEGALCVCNPVTCLCIPASIHRHRQLHALLNKNSNACQTWDLLLNHSEVFTEERVLVLHILLLNLHLEPGHRCLLTRIYCPCC